MDIGIGLPNTVPGTEGRTLIDWARHAEEAGFSTLGTIGRLVYPNYEELVALSAAAAVTSQIRLTTGVLLAPLYTNTALFAKQAASLDRLSGGRLVLGLGLGGREDDFAASGVSMHHRGRRLEEQIAMMRRIWSGEEFGYRRRDRARARAARRPRDHPGRCHRGQLPPGRPDRRRLDHGRRHARHVRPGRGRRRSAWQEEGRPGRPRKLTLAYYGLGPEARSQAEGYILHYYGWLGDIAGMIASGAAVSAEMVKSYVAAFEASGCDEIIFVPTASRLDQVSLLADAIA